MPNLPVPTFATEVPGDLSTSALYNAVGSAGVGFTIAVPIASLYQTVTQSLATNTNIAITFDSESADTYGGHSTTSNTSRYVAQIAGYYAIIGTICYASNATGWRNCTIAKNGSLAAVNGGWGVAQATSSTGALSGVTAVGVVYMNGSGDYVEIYGDQNSGSTVATAVGATIQQCSMTLWWMHS